MSILVITLLAVLDIAAAQQANQDCSKIDTTATEFLQSFPIVTTETIAKGTECTYTIKAADPQKVFVYLVVNGTATENQCITVENGKAKAPQKICGRKGGNTFTSDGQEVKVTFSSTDATGSAPNFHVMYKFANSAYCTDTSPMATDSEKSFKIIQSDVTIAKNTYCSWTISTANTQNIVVRLAVDAQTDKQCVSVSNDPRKSEKTICGKQSDNTFTSRGQEVTVTFLASNTATDIKNFEVFFKTENSKECSTTIPDASAVQQSFSITTTENIPKDTQCMWTIKAADPQKVLVYLAANGTATETQCVTVDNKQPTGPKTICGKPNENSFTSTGQEVIVSYSSTGASEAAPNFRVMYRFANSDACTVASPMATDTEQSLSIIKTDGTIPNNAYCSWTITASSPQRVKVYLTTEGTTTENQCVSASNKPNETGQKICGKQGQNEFTSDGQEVTVTYPAPQPAKDVKNFKILFKTSGARRDSAWIAGILSVYILSRLLL